MSNWETETYSVRSAPESEVAAELSYRASSGWELVSVVLHGDSSGSPELVAFFKRPK